MPITDLLERNSKLYGEEIALVEINPEIQEAQRVTWKEYELQLLSKMTNYCNTSMCLRKVLLEYFGEKTTSQCNNCGNCDVNKNASWRKFLKF